MKKVFVAAAIVLGTISFTACSGEKKEGMEGTDTTTMSTEPMTTEPMVSDSTADSVSTDSVAH